jgi:O-antigen ligase
MIPDYRAVVLVIVAQFLGNIYFIATQQGLFLNGANRYFGLTDRMIVLSGLINFLCVVYAFTIYRETRPNGGKLALYFPVLLALFNVTMTSSRSTLIATVLFIVFFYNISFGFKRLLAVIVLLGGFITAAVFLAPDSMARFATIADFSEGSNFSRVQFSIAGLNMFLEHPFMGVGPGVSHRLLEQYIPWEESPSMHFDLLLVAAELGMFGLLSVLWCMSKLRLLRPILIVVVLMLSTQNMFYYAPYFVVILAAMSMATVSVDQWKRKRN